MPYKNDVFMQTYRKHPEYAGDGLSDDSDLELDNLSKTPLSRPGPQLSRLEQKALDKEIPWQHIFNGPKDVLEKFKEAARSEEASWKLWQSVIPLDDKQAKAILQDPLQKKRVLRSRSAFRDKSKGVPPLERSAGWLPWGIKTPISFHFAVNARLHLGKLNTCCFVSS